MTLPDREHFALSYEGLAPWDIDGPQPALASAADQVRGSVLDVGCGTGEHALFFAQRGHKVTGVDFLEEPIRRAKQKAAERDLTATFLVMDALALKEIPELFDTAIDSGLFHVFSDDDRRRYVDGMTSVVKPGGRLFLLCFSDDEPGTQGPRRISRRELEDTFSSGWTIESITATRFQIRPEPMDVKFSDGGPKAWFVVAERNG